jgi:hypothetical protein
MQSEQHAANGRNSGHSGARQAQTEAAANTLDRLDTPRKKDKRQQPSPRDPRTRGPPTNGKCSSHGGTTEYGAAAGSGDDDGWEKRPLAIAKTWQER